ncbi:MFS transporter [Actinoallomurus purpureus]|uniref:MFS transporter n=1 Tax=Actinoallomurus purpureus TaxID=478114 RepID=UPI0020921729|nr:MFS transporter [Actinoallomurus purpureus]MCO6010254.1 MFS transporter [Actinoallomurus purpureus]
MNRRWSVLGVGLFAMIAGCAYQYGLPYLIPALRADAGLSLDRAAMLISCPVAGLLVSLALWGVAADRWGERIILAMGLAVAGAALLAAAAMRDLVALGACFFVAGAGGASIHAASGRLILGWFAAHERGLAMGVRQTGQPLGVGLAALVLPPLAAGAGLAGGLVFLACCCLAAALLVALLVRDPARTEADEPHGGRSPYRTPVLWRIHAASALLVVPQFAVSAFALVYLVDAQGWNAGTAGRLLAAAQIGGAAARLAVGHWSDRAGSRLRPMRILAMGIGVVMLSLTFGALAGWGATPVVLVVAAVITVTTNGLAFTAVAEYAGRAWAGRALGIQNTGQNLLAAATPPVLGLLVTGSDFGTAFAVAVAFPVVAGLLLPIRAEQPSTRSAAPAEARARR